jgi:HPt (histidine-containing phosphotransfer) domain-containing protein
MDDFLAKPIQAAALTAAIERVTAIRPSVVAPPDAATREPSLLDPPVLLAACGGDPAILEKICQAFRARLPDHLAAVQQALQQRDAPRLREAAHKLAGMVAAFSTEAGRLASDLEDHAADDQLDTAPALVQRLATMAQELMHLTGSLSLQTLRHQADSTRQLNPATGRNG